MNRGIQVRAITSLPELKNLECEWYGLWRRCPSLSIFQSPDWLIPWVEVFSPHRLWIIEARRDSALVGLAPLFIYGTAGDRIVAPLGAGISDYLDVLVDPEFPEALDAVAKFLRDHGLQWTELHFPDLRDSSLLLRPGFLGTFSGEESYELQQQACEFCPQLSLPGEVDELRTVVPAKQLRNLRSARRLLAGAEVELATAATLDEFLADLFRLHAKRWQSSGEAGVLADPRVRTLHTLAAPRLLERGMLRLFGLRFCGQVIACLMAFAERDTMRLYLQGYDPEWAGYSPGAQLVGAALEQAVREQKHTADFMRGRETYKYYWGSQDVPTFRLHIATRRPLATPFPEKSVA